MLLFRASRFEQNACSAVSSAVVVGYFESHIVGAAVDVERHFHVVEALAHIGYFKTLHEAALIALERELVHEQLHISHAVDVAIDVEVAIFEAVLLGVVVGHGQESRRRAYRARMVAYHVLEEGEARYVDYLAGLAVDDCPDGASISQSGAVLVENLEVTKREMTIGVLHPGDESVFSVHLRILCHLDAHARQHPSEVVGAESGVTYVPHIGMLGGDFDYAR